MKGAILAYDFSDVAQKLGLHKHDLVEARRLMTGVSVIPEALALAEQGATAIHDVTRGGLLETLLEIAQLSEVGLQVDTKRILIPPIVTRFAEAFQFEPLKMISSGTLVATLSPDRIEEAGRILIEKGISFADIGRVSEGSGVQITTDGGLEHYQEVHCEEDELARMWDLYLQGDAHDMDDVND